MAQFAVAAPAYGAQMAPSLHLGYPMVLADAVARYRRLRGDSVLFSAGSNESSQQLAAAAAREDLAPLRFAERAADEHAAVWSGLNISQDRVVRTSHPVHHDVVQGAMARMFRLGDVYWGPMRGWFCLSCETLWEGPEVSDGRCPTPDCRREVRWIGTETYLVRSSQYRERIREHLQGQTGCSPPIRRRARRACWSGRSPIPTRRASRTGGC
jgi:methionyl-tRNA synthetase